MYTFALYQLQNYILGCHAAIAPTGAGDDVPVFQFLMMKHSHWFAPIKHVEQSVRVQASASLTAQQAGQQIDRKRLQGVTGRSSIVSSTLFAAVKTTEKAVLCIDNVSKNCNENDILYFMFLISGWRWSRVSPTNPSRRPNETADDVQDRKAFRPGAHVLMPLIVSVC